MKTYKFEIFFYCLIVVLLFLLVLSARGQQAGEIQLTGGAFTVTKAVVAGGGNSMQTGPTTASATAGQTVAGKISTGGQFTVHSGFWTPDDFTPTAATAVVGGRVTTAEGAGIRNVIVTITFPSGETRIARSAAGGYYSFSDIPVGDTYVFSVSAKNYTFVQSTLVRNISDDTNEIDFQAAPRNTVRTNR